MDTCWRIKRSLPPCSAAIAFEELLSAIRKLTSEQWEECQRAWRQSRPDAEDPSYSPES